MLYKLTDQNFESYGKTKWGPGVTHRAADGSPMLCSSTVIHAYRSPELAALFNPIHADFKTPVCWECPSEKILIGDGMKIGVKQLTTVCIIPLPVFSLAALVRFAIYCVPKSFEDVLWRAWAGRWLSGENRSRIAAVETVMTMTTAPELTKRAAAVRGAQAAAMLKMKWAMAQEVATLKVAEAAEKVYPAPNFQALIEKAVRDELSLYVNTTQFERVASY